MRFVTESVAAVLTVGSLYFIHKYELLYDRERLLRFCFTRVINRGMHRPKHKVHLVRNVFRSTTIPYINQIDHKTHTHPLSAANRSSCATFSGILSARLGLEPFLYQAAPADVRDGLAYSRDYYWGKDVLVPPSGSVITDRHLGVMVDVDYYVDLPKHLLYTNDNPQLLYSFQPTKAAKSDGEYVYTFNHDGTITYQVSGGAEYVHKVWALSKDVVTVSDWWKCRSFVLERKKIDDHHEYILFVPIATWYGLYAWLASWLSADKLSRLEPVQGDFAVLDVHTKTGLVKSVARVGRHTSAEVDVKTFNALESVCRNSALKLGNAVVQSWVDNDKIKASILVDYFRNQPKIQMPAVIYPAEIGLKGYEILKDIRDKSNDNDKPLMEPFMAPLYPKTYVPLKNINNEIAAVTGRVLKPAKEALMLAERPPSKMLITCMQEFVDRLVPNKHQGIPVDIDEVYERQSRPSQRQLLERADVSEAKHTLETFMKAEPYQKTTDPRIISVYNPVTKRAYSQYIYALADFIMKQPWYAFGKTPKQIAEYVAYIALNSWLISCADANRMDGHIHQILRDLELMVMYAFFRTEYHSDILEKHGHQYNLRAMTTLGVKYNIDTQRGSGSPETALFNTTTGAKFVDYYARRLRGDSPDEAYGALGIFGGDDMTSGNLETKWLVQAGAAVGQVIENVEFYRGQPGVNFLSRMFMVEVWYGRTDSTCDITRMLAKLHVTQHVDAVAPVEKLRQKLAGLIRTDRNTLVFCEIIGCALRVGMNLDFTPDLNISSWWAQYDADENWPNGVLLEECVFDHDYTHLRDYLDQCKVPEDLLTMPAIELAENFQPNNKSLVSVDDDLKQPPEEVAATPLCKRFIENRCVSSKCTFQHTKVCTDYWTHGSCSRKTCSFPHVHKF